MCDILFLFNKETIIMIFTKKAVRRTSALIAALLVAATVSITGTPAEAFAAGETKGTVSADYLNVRSSPGLNKTIIQVIEEGSTVVIVKTENGWHKIKLGNNKYGWVSADYIKTKSDDTTIKTTTTTTKKKTTATTKKAASTSSEKTNGTVTVTGSYTNFRKGAGFGYAVIMKLPKGTTGGILQKDGSWYKIKLKDAKVGWVNKQYIKVTGYKDNTAKSDTKKIIIDVSSVNVRSIPSTSGKLVATVRHNEVYTYSEIKDGWYKIVTPSGACGYVCGDYVAKFKSYAVKGGGKYIWPTQTATRISTYFGTHNGRTHYGLDIAAPGGSQIIAVADGKVLKKSYTPNGFGNLIVIEQNDGVRAYYAHMQKESFLNKGDKVKAGDTIGIVGTTGKSTGNHLHLEFRKEDERIDPIDYFSNMKKK